MRSVLINASNLQVGGGVQVAASFLDELTLLTAEPEFLHLHPWLAHCHVLASTAVLGRALPATRRLLDVEERNARFDLRARWGPAYDLSFTLFGPEYVPHRAKVHVVGFADVTSLVPEFARRSEHFDAGSRLRGAVRHTVSRRRFRGADHVVVEAPPVREALQRRWGIAAHDVTVVSNTYDSVFNHPERWSPIAVPTVPGKANVCYVARGYVHKNHAILGPLGDELERRGRPVQFVLTLSDDEWARVSADARRHSVNLGVCEREQLPLLYRACEASVFPSLLECFSATPVESLVMGTPLVASDRPFVRGICHDAPWYADPQDASSLADALERALSGSDATVQKVDEGRAVVALLPSARDRAVSYVELITSLLL